MTYEPLWMKELRKLPGGARVIAKYKKPKAEGTGERLPDCVGALGFFRLDTAANRSYVKCIAEGGGVTWWYRDPLGHWAVTGAAHLRPDGEPCAGCRAVEEDDGTLTIRGEINNYGPYETWWRGTLLKGVWEGKAIYPEKSLAVE